MRQRAGCAICFQLVALVGAWTRCQAIMQPPVCPSASTSKARVTDLLSNATTAVSDAISAAASHTSMKSKTASKDKIDAEYVQNMVTSGLGAAIKVVVEATQQRFRKLETDIADLKATARNITQVVKLTDTHSEQIEDLRARLLQMGKTEANRQADSERIRLEQL